ncbi:TetR/AcrR family transcriptional regulator [Thermoflavimicrobium dichotomicum]|uniref:DNA-binding transcriptional regulator, AcrR family n=1 Tax=Thermoflavimicrobium dichotomicum TaxID=46223 RepID=A0A1I3NKM9_9BACL|nr:TetR/AcrR family transcriptional regulator [Thermoflavimicrobium dichotomicum]SFJ09739.1 DNA-binding transcriptional regulator, AcrR family [Thermoflavimicrobium dichotomicum]
MGKSTGEMREKILQAAKKLFAKQGYEGTSIRQICEEAGANIALVSYYFGGKEKLFYAVFDEYFHAFDIQYTDPIEGLREFVRILIERRVHFMEIGDILMSEFAMGTPRSEKLLQYTMPTWEVLKKILVQGKEEGKFQFSSVEYAFHMIMAVLLFPRYTLRRGPYPLQYDLSVEEMIEATLQFIFDGLLVKK